MTTTVAGGCACGQRWTGARTAHCGACHQTFGGVNAFDQHRSTAGRLGSCTAPEALGLEFRRNAWRGPEADFSWTRHEAAQP